MPNIWPRCKAKAEITNIMPKYMGFREYLKSPLTTKVLAFSGLRGLKVVLAFRKDSKDDMSMKRPVAARIMAKTVSAVLSKTGPGPCRDRAHIINMVRTPIMGGGMRFSRKLMAHMCQK